MLKVTLSNSGTNKELAYVQDNALLVAPLDCPPVQPQHTQIFRQYLTCNGSSDGGSDMMVGVGVARTDGACSDHTDPTYTFTSVTGGLACAQKIQITDAGAGGHALIGIYKVMSVNSATSVELDRDPTDGTNETVIGFVILPIEFWVGSSEDADRYITAVSFVIAGSAMKLSDFGTGAALTNGCDFEYIRNIGQTIVIHGNLTSNWDFIRLCMGTPSFGDAATSFIASNVVGAIEATIPVFNFLSVLPPYGLKIEAGTQQKLLLRVNEDTITDVSAFDAIVYGFERLI